MIARLILSILSRVTASMGAPTFAEFAEPYLAEKLANPTIRKATKVSFENQVRKHLIPAFGDLPLDEINNAAWLRWVTGTTAITRFFNARKALLEILHAAVEAGHLERAPKLDNPDERRDVGRVLDDREIIALLWRSRRPFRFIFYTFWKMGCRPREILQWEWSMLEWRPDGRVYVNVPARISKTGRSRCIPVNPDVARILASRRKRLEGLTVFCFPSTVDARRPQISYHSAWRTTSRKAGVKAMAYDFRRTLITRHASGGEPIVYVAKLLDTSSKMIEGTYAKSQAHVLERLVQ